MWAVLPCSMEFLCVLAESLFELGRIFYSTTYPRSCGHHSIWKDKKIQAYQLKYVLKEIDDL